MSATIITGRRADPVEPDSRRQREQQEREQLDRPEQRDRRTRDTCSTSTSAASGSASCETCEPSWLTGLARPELLEVAVPEQLAAARAQRGLRVGDGGAGAASCRVEDLRPRAPPRRVSAPHQRLRHLLDRARRSESDTGSAREQRRRSRRPRAQRATQYARRRSRRRAAAPSGIVPQTIQRIDAFMRPCSRSGVIAWRRLTCVMLYAIAAEPEQQRAGEQHGDAGRLAGASGQASSAGDENIDRDPTIVAADADRLLHARCCHERADDRADRRSRRRRAPAANDDMCSVARHVRAGRSRT